MARITIEDCMEQVPNRFQLVRMASIRAKQLKKGARPLMTADANKEVVTSLREIAAGLVKPGDAEVPEAPEYAAEFAADTIAAEGEAAAPEGESPFVASAAVGEGAAPISPDEGDPEPTTGS